MYANPSFRQIHASRDLGLPYQQLHARRDRAKQRFDILDGERKFGELAITDGRFVFLGTDIELTHCIAPRVAKLHPLAHHREALAAIRAGVEYYLAVEDDVSETITDEGHALIREYRYKRQDYEIEVDSDCVEILKPTVDRLRALEKALNLIPYVILGSVYNGLGDDA